MKLNRLCLLTYESFNRIVAVFLALQSASLLAFYIARQDRLGRFDRRLLAIALVTWAAMAVGTAAEFWLCSDLPCPGATFEVSDINMRMVSFSLFFFGSLLGGLVLLVLGIRLARNGTSDRLYAVLCILHLTLFFVGSAIFGSLFAAPALTSTALAGLSLRLESKSSTAELGF